MAEKTTEVTDIVDDGSFLKAIKKSSDDKTKVVVDFTATWCGPCKVVAPVFKQLAAQHSSTITFLSVDIDKCKGVAVGLNIRSIPTFHFYFAGLFIKETKGADVEKLKEDINNFASQTEEELNQLIDQKNNENAEGDLSRHIDFGASECLNDMKDHPYLNIFKADNSFVKSHADEQLLMNLTFKRQLQIKTLKFVAPSDGSGPKKLKLFVNRLNLGFSQAEDEAAAQEFNLTPKDLEETTDPLKLNLLKFAKVTSLSIFIQSNQQGLDQTQLTKLIIFGKANVQK
eukprot:TRINITY_DN1339_c0_g3_i1.p1 TRINITY_DN1339_c0_g3~~TRINITY_DN1339_c0_g3_i1.p1  ORF type:complete len:285 (+),score=54.59 TRINITY_DN1339_c0_g3_i1:40-894(+)